MNRAELRLRALGMRLAASVAVLCGLAAAVPAPSSSAAICPSGGIDVNYPGLNPMCAWYYDSGQIALKPWHTSTTNVDLCVNYYLWQYNHWTTGSPVSIAHSTSECWDSATYTNWGTSETHFARTTDLAYDRSRTPDLLPSPLAEPNPIPPPHCCQPIGGSPPRDATPARPVPGTTSQTLVSGSDAAGIAPAATSATCPAHEHLVHAEGNFGTLPSGAPGARPRVVPYPVVASSPRGARARLGGASLPRGTSGVLSLSIICGMTHRSQRFTDASGRTILIGSAGNQTLTAPRGGATIYAGSGTVTLTGQSGGDVLYGGAGRDTLRARGSSDVLIGGTNANRETASPLASARTLLVAGPGQNTLIAGPGRNDIDSRRGAGANTIRCAGTSIVMARRRDRLIGRCTKVIYTG